MRGDGECEEITLVCGGKPRGGEWTDFRPQIVWAAVGRLSWQWARWALSACLSWWPEEIFIHQEKQVTSHEVWSCEVFGWRESSRVQVCVTFC